jgi:hypothetical protein
MIRAVEALLNLTSALGIDTRGIADDVLEIIALRIVVEDVLPTKLNVERIITEVRLSEAGGSDGLASARPSEPPHRKPRYLATEATEAKMRQRLARAHRTEDVRTGLRLVPRRPEVMRPGAVHPACKAAHADGAIPCVRCTPLLHAGTCDCDICDRWWNEADA